MIMLQTLRKTLRSSRNGSLSKAFSRLRWVGVWVQIAFGSIPVLLFIYAFIFSRNTGVVTRGRLPLIEYLTFASLLARIFMSVDYFVRCAAENTLSRRSLAPVQMI